MAMLDSFTDLIGLGSCGRLGRESICQALNQKLETQVLTPAVPGVLLCDPGLATFLWAEHLLTYCSNIFWELSSKVMEIKAKISKWHLTKLKNFCTANEVISKTTTKNWQKIFANNETDNK